MVDELLEPVGFPGLTEDDRTLVRNSLQELAVELALLAHLTIGRPAQPGSMQERDLAESIAPGDMKIGNPITLAGINVLLATLAGTDHVRAFVRSTKNDRTSVAGATLTRGGIEAFAKAHFLLSAVDAAERVPWSPAGWWSFGPAAS